MLLYLKEVDYNSSYSIDNFISVTEIYKEVVYLAKGNTIYLF